MASIAIMVGIQINIPIIHVKQKKSAKVGKPVLENKNKKGKSEMNSHKHQPLRTIIFLLTIFLLAFFIFLPP